MSGRWAQNRTPSNPRRGYYFAIVSLTAASVLVILVSLFVMLGISMSLGTLTLALWFYAVSCWRPKLVRLKMAKTTQITTIHPAPMYLIILPLVVLLIPLVLTAPLTEFSRNHAIANSREIINDIEEYHVKHGQYPISLAAMWKDYDPDVVGVEKFHYAPHGESYNLFFEQPRFMIDNIGTREWVVYNPHDEHRMYSHAAWFLLLTPEQLERSQGWYAVHNAKVPHWKYFWFD
jgi:hypothetical protein